MRTETLTTMADLSLPSFPSSGMVSTMAKNQASPSVGPYMQTNRKNSDGPHATYMRATYD